MVEYVYDPSVDEELDRQLRVLLTTCFPGTLFQNKRYNCELPMHRWIIRDEAGLPVAHVAVHDKWIGSATGKIHVGGVAEVCVHPDHRGKKHVAALLSPAHKWMQDQGMSFSVLFGNTKVYGSLGYANFHNSIRYYHMGRRAWVLKPDVHAMKLSLTDIKWPEGDIDLLCPLF